MKVDHRTVKMQGDVFLMKVDVLPEQLQKVQSEQKILQDSELQGKYHRFHPDAEVDIYITPGMEEEGGITIDQGKYIVVHKEAMLFHGRGFNPNPSEETKTDHHGFMVPPGTYKVGIQKVYDYESGMVRSVVD